MKNNNAIKSIIVSAFPMSGKTFNSQTCFLNSKVEGYNFKKDFIDIHLGEFMWLDKKNKIKNPDFPENYVDEVKKNIGKTFCILISSNQEVCNEMKKRNINYTIFYPKKDLKEKIIENIKKDENRSEEFLEAFNENFEKEIERIENDNFPNKIEMSSPKQFISQFKNFLNDNLKNRKTLNKIPKIPKIKKYAVFGIHDDDRKNGEMFIKYLKKHFPISNLFYFLTYTTFSVYSKKNYIKALKLGRDYYNKTKGTDKELRKTFEANIYQEKRPFNSKSLFAIDFFELSQNTNWEDYPEFKNIINLDIIPLEKFLNNLNLVVIKYMPNEVQNLIKNISEKFNMKISNFFTKWNYTSHNLEIIYIDENNKIDNQIKDEIFDFAKVDKSLNSSIYKNVYKGLIKTDEFGLFIFEDEKNLSNDEENDDEENDNEYNL